jgi:hypothetical protein
MESAGNIVLLYHSPEWELFKGKVGVSNFGLMLSMDCRGINWRSWTEGIRSNTQAD